MTSRNLCGYNFVVRQHHYTLPSTPDSGNTHLVHLHVVDTVKTVMKSIIVCPPTFTIDHFMLATLRSGPSSESVHSVDTLFTQLVFIFFTSVFYTDRWSDVTYSLIETSSALVLLTDFGISDDIHFSRIRFQKHTTVEFSHIF